MKIGPYEIKPILMDIVDDPVWKWKCDNCIIYMAGQGVHEIERVHGIYGKSWHVSGSEDCWYQLDGRPDEHFFIGQGKMSNYLTQILCLNVALRMPYDYFMILEEDCEFVPNWKEKLDKTLTDLHEHDPNWDLFYVGSCCARDKKPQQVKELLHFWPYRGNDPEYGKFGWQYGPQCNHALIYNKKCIPTILEHMTDASNPFDAGMLKFCGEYLKTYGAIPRLAGQRDTHLWE